MVREPVPVVRMLLPLSFVLVLAGCQQEIRDGGKFFRLAVAHEIGLVKGPFGGDYWVKILDETYLFDLEPEEAIGIPKLEALRREIQDSMDAFIAGYKGCEERMSSSPRHLSYRWGRVLAEIERQNLSEGGKCLGR